MGNWKIENAEVEFWLMYVRVARDSLMDVLTECSCRIIMLLPTHSINKENKIFSRSEIHISRETHLARKKCDALISLST